MNILFHGARKLDHTGHVDDFWMLVDGDTIVETGSGRPPALAAIREASTREASTRKTSTRDVSTGIGASVELVDVCGQWLVPGFIDLHGHGGGGHSFDGARSAAEAESEIRAGVAAHRAHGTSRSVISLVANPLADLEASLSTIADLTESDPTILGSHLEGPFLAEERKGAHNPSFLRPPSPTAVEGLIAASRGTLRQLTLAPELEGAFEAIDILVAAGVVVAVGHTQADFETATAAFDRGARLLTHVFNAMNGIHHRAPGPIIAAFGDERVMIELILDGHHVHPDVAGLVFREAPGRVALITDAMAAAGSHDGDYRLGSLDVTVSDGLAVLRGTSSIAGSTLTQDAALRFAVSRVGVSPVAAITALTRTPARALGLDHRLGTLAPGFAADAVILDHDFRVQRVWANGAAIA